MRKLICTFLLFVIVSFTGQAKAQQVNTQIDSLMHLLTIETYAAHFDSLRTGPFNNRRVRPQETQSTDHDACRDYIYRQFLDYFADSLVYIHFFEKGNYKGLSNVLAFKPGTKPEAGIWIIGAHYDSNNNMNTDSLDYSPGANDNGTGVAAILEIARIISDLESDASVLIAAWDFEERFTNGLPTGSNEWYRNYVKRFGKTDLDNVGRGAKIKRRDIEAYLNFDMFGNPGHEHEGKPVLWVCYAMNRHIGFANEYATLVNEYVPEIHVIPYGRMIFSDHFTFAFRRIPSVENLQSDYMSDKFYHTRFDHKDNPDNIDYEFAVHVARGGLAFLLKNIGISQ